MRTLITVAAAMAIAAICSAQDQKTKVKQVPITYTGPSAGPEMFSSYCAPCHGTDGKGTGPAASAMKKPPTDLTLLSRKNNGKFPTITVQNTIKGDPTQAAAAHGSKDMPVWGPAFRSVSGYDDNVVTLRVEALSKYIEGIQQK